jgi:hypothetical protein
MKKQKPKKSKRNRVSFISRAREEKRKEKNQVDGSVFSQGGEPAEGGAKTNKDQDNKPA